MADRKQQPADPFQMWREWLDRTERQLNTTFNDLMGTEAYAAASGRWMEMFLAYQGTLNEATERYFSALNLPTRSGISEVTERLASIEQRLEGLEQAVSALAGTTTEGKPVRGVRSSARGSGAPRPPRTKKAATKAPARKSGRKKTARKSGATASTRKPKASSD